MLGGSRLRAVAPAVVALLLALGQIAFALDAAVRTHAIRIPQNDDWSYTRSALYLFHTGHIQLQGWGQMFLLGQLYTSQPFLWVFGATISSLDLYGALACLVWMVCVYFVGARVVGRWPAVLVIATLVLWPGLGLLTSSFMTDLPGWAVSMLTVLVGVQALQRNSRWWLLATLAVGFFAFTIREQMIAGVGAVLIGILVSKRCTKRFRVEAVAGVVVLAVVCDVLEHLRHALPHPDVAPFSLAHADFGTVPPNVRQLAFTLGLEIAPLILLGVVAVRRRGWLNPGRVIGWVLGVLAYGTLTGWRFDRTPVLLLGNYLTLGAGFNTASVGTPVPRFGTSWEVAQAVAGLAGVLLLGEIVARIVTVRATWRSVRTGDGAVPILAAYTVILALTSIALAYGGQRQVDRYQLGILPGLMIMLVAARWVRVPAPLPSAPSRAPVEEGTSTEPVAAGSSPAHVTPQRAGALVWGTRGVTAVAMLAIGALMAYLSVFSTVRTDQRDHAVWSAATKLVKQGVRPTRINGGLDWDGWHSAPVNRDNAHLERYRGEHWTYLFPAATDCWIVSISPIKRHLVRLVRTERYPHQQIWIYRNRSCRTPLGKPQV